MGWIPRYLKTMGANFGEVVEGRIYRGSLPDMGDLFELTRERGIRTILSLMDDEKKLDRLAAACDELDLTHSIIRLSDRVPPTSEQVSEFLRLTKQAVPAIYVQCHGGRHRTGLMCAIYRCVEQDWSKDFAWREAERYGFYSERGHGDLRRYFFEEFDPADFQTVDREEVRR